MNREIIVGILKDRPGLKAQHSQLVPSTLCSNINRDLPILMTKVEGARKTVDVGLSITGGERFSPYEPYRAAGFWLFRSGGATESDVMKDCLRSSFRKGYGSVVLLAHSVPSLPTSYIESTLKILREQGGIVLGPLVNGGFYLIGATRSAFDSSCCGGTFPRLVFCDKTKQHEVTEMIGALGIRLHFLPEWYRVETEEDLKRLSKKSGGRTSLDARWTRHTV